MQKTVQYLLARGEEPSTWAGTGLAAIVIHMVAPGAAGDALITLLASAAACLAIFVPEKIAG